MTYSAFKQLVLSYLKKQLGDSVRISIQPITRNNQVHLDGLLILEPDCNIAPTLYLDYYYERLLAGAPPEEILQQLLDTYRAHKPEGTIDVSFFTDYQNVSKQILYKLINTKENLTLLQEIPHIAFLDLSVVFFCLLSFSDSGSATILIRNEHLALWNATTDMLYQNALVNTPKLLPPRLLDLNSVLKELSTDVSAPAASSPIYVLTNVQKLYGAAGILYSKILHNFALTRQSDFYILPSSIHEVLLLPAARQPHYSELNKMVQEVNRTQLSREEVLSDHVYYYSLQEQTIKIMP